MSNTLRERLETRAFSSNRISIDAEVNCPHFDEERFGPLEDATSGAAVLWCCGCGSLLIDGHWFVPWDASR